MSFTAVPEPASWMLLLGAAGTVGLWRCRRRRSAALVDGTGSGRWCPGGCAAGSSR